jgi:uncharacterized YccA/Bax inhibitor family protein
VRSSNPVLTRLGQAVRGQSSSPGSQYGQNPFQAQYNQYNQYGQPAPYGYPPAPPVAAGRVMTLDDVVVRTLALLVLTALAAGASWLLLDGPAAVLGMIGSIIAGLVLGLVISFMRITNPLVISAYAVIEGVLLGVVSKWFESAYGGIVIQAVAGTIGVFLIMAALYKFRILQASPTFVKVVVGALLGFVALSVLNLVVYAFGGNLGLVDYNVTGNKVGFLPILFAGAGIVIGALTFILDFAEVENGVRQGLPEKYAWYCAFGLLVGLIFLYWQILRLLGYLRR